jgi:transcriptional antiterminator RfaH
MGFGRMLRWYLIHTKPVREGVAEENLRRQGYEIYLPRMLQRYLFLQLSEGHQALSPVRSSVGVAGVVRFGTRYAIVSHQIITQLRLRADPESGLHYLAKHPSLARGATVRITAGPFEGLDGVFEREAGSARVVVLLNLLGQDAAVRIPADAVAPSYAA